MAMINLKPMGEDEEMEAGIISDKRSSEENEKDEMLYDPNPEEFPQHDINPQEVMDSIKINMDEKDESESEDSEESIKDKSKDPKVEKKINNKTKSKKTTEEKTQELYDEFSTFLEVKADITPDIGIKQVIPTGIDLVDAILGGGFGVGTMNIICGSPGSGKCLFYNEEIEIYVEEYKRIMKIGKVFDEYAVNPEKINEIVKTKKPIYIKNKKGDLVKLEGVIKKDKCELLNIELTNNVSIRCAKKHLIEIKPNVFKTGNEIEINDIIYNDKNEKLIVLIIENILNVDTAYDVSMEKDHVYKTTNGIFHHNSMLAAQTLGNAQLEYKGDLLGAFLDSEESTSSVRLANLGVKYPKIKPYIDITVEKVFKFLEGLCLFKEEKKIINKPSVVVWDSIANTLSQREREAEDINTVIGFKARLLSMLIPRYIAKISQYQISLICVNQLRDNLDMSRFGSPRDLKFLSHTKHMPGGSSLLYNSFQLVEMKIKSAFNQEKERYGFDGIIVKIKCVKNKLFAPNIEIELVGSFISGFSNLWTNYNFLVNTKRLNVGAWKTLITMPEKKFRQKDLETFYNSDEEFRNEFNRLTKEGIQKDIIDKYS